jgi:hypothetical protein
VRATADSGAATAASHAALTTGAESPGWLALTIGLVVVLALAYAAPIVIGVASPLHLVIAGFALYEAWKLNRGVALRITGPYQAAAPGAAA